MKYHYIITLAFNDHRGAGTRTYANTITLQSGTGRSEAFTMIRDGVKSANNLPPAVTVLFFSLEPEQLSVLGGVS